MSDFVSMTELITQDYLCYQLKKSNYDFETFLKWPTVYCQGCKSKLETDVFTRCYTCDDSKMYTVPEEKSDEAQCQRELELMRKTCDIFKEDFEKGFEIDTANINPNKATVLITLLQEADNLFKNETNSKGIVYLLIISGELAKKCAEKGYDSEVNSIQRITSWYINEKLGPWINEHGGWECFFKWSESINKFYDAFKEIVLHFMEHFYKRMEYTNEEHHRLNMFLDSIIEVNIHARKLDQYNSRKTSLKGQKTPSRWNVNQKY